MKNVSFSRTIDNAKKSVSVAFLELPASLEFWNSGVSEQLLAVVSEDERLLLVSPLPYETIAKAVVSPIPNRRSGLATLRLVKDWERVANNPSGKQAMQESIASFIGCADHPDSTFLAEVWLESLTGVVTATACLL